MDSHNNIDIDEGLNDTKADMYKVIIQPLPVYFECCDYHVMLYLDGHKDYEAIEAMIVESSCGEPQIRLIITLHGGMQVDHINDEDLADRLKVDKRKRKVFYTTMEYIRQSKKGIAHIHLAFRSFQGEYIQFDLHAISKASPSRIGIINPGEHSKQFSLPVMYPERTTLAGAKSSIKIDDTEYKIPVKIKIPLLFKGLKGYYSELFNIAVFRAGTRNISVIGFPAKVEVGEEWVYDNGGKKETFRIEERTGDNIIIRGMNCKIHAEIKEEHLLIQKVTFYSNPPSGPQSDFTVEFTPSIPAPYSNTGNDNNKFDFTMSINNHKSIITGTATINNSNGFFSTDLIPSQPEWAVARPVSINIRELPEGLFSIKTQILEH